MIEYTFKIESLTNTSISFDVHPFNKRDIAITIEPEEDYQFYRENIKNGITLIDSGKEGIYDYTNILKVLESDYPTHVFQFNIYMEDELEFSGLFTIYDIEYDDDNNKGIIKLTPYDNYQKIFDVWETDVNILNTTKTRVYDNYYSRLEMYASTSSSPINSDWKEYYHASDLVNDIGITDIYIYAREYVKTSLNTNLFSSYFDYVNSPDSDGYYYLVREYDLYNYSAPANADIHVIIAHQYGGVLSTENGKSVVWNSDLTAKSGWNLIPTTISNVAYDDGEWPYGFYIYIDSDFYNFEKFAVEEIIHSQAIELKTAINYCLSQLGLDYECKSTFLFNDALPSIKPQWIQNILNERTTYNYITRDYSDINNLYIIEKTDYKNPLASNPATINNIKLSDLIKDLNIIFIGCLNWEIDVDGYFRIEHQRYFNSTFGIDLTTDMNETTESGGYQYRTGINYLIPDKYKYSDKLPQKEIFKPFEAANSDFIEFTIKYNIPVIGAQENKEEKQLSILVTDCDYATQNLNIISNSGSILVVCDETDDKMYVTEDAGYISGTEIKNARLSFANLFDKYGRDYRYLLTGIVNNNSEEFDSIRPNKEQESIEIVAANNPNPRRRIKTNLGYGIPKQIERSIYSGNTKIILQYDNLDYYELIS